MKSCIIVTFIGALFISTTSFSQDLSVSDEELVKYATVMDSISEMQSSIKLQITDMIKTSSVMDISRYNTLVKIINDPAQLETAKATPQEIEFVKEVSAKQTEGVDQVKAAYQSLAKDYVTPKVFNKVKKAISEDQQVKQKYDSIIFVMGRDNPTSGQ